MANICVIRVRGLDPFSGEIKPRQQCKPVSMVLVVFREGEAFLSKSGHVAIDGYSNGAKLLSQCDQRIDGTITANQNFVLIHVGTSALVKRTCSYETLLEDRGAMRVGEKHRLNSTDPRFYRHGAKVLRHLRRWTEDLGHPGIFILGKPTPTKNQ